MDIVTNKSKIIREPRDIPNTPGLRIVGVTKDKQFVWLTVQKGKDACCTLGEGVRAIERAAGAGAGQGLLVFSARPVFRFSV